MKIIKMQPAYCLKPYIQYYKYIELDIVGVYKAIPIADVELYFNCTHVEVFTNNYSLDFPKICITGLHNLLQDTYIHMYGTGKKCSFAIIFKPTGFLNLFEINPLEFKNYLNNWDVMSSASIYSVWEQMENIMNPYEIKKNVEKFLCKYLSTKFRKNQMVDYIVNYMKFNNGILRTKQICEEFNITPRTLQRYFKEAIGMCPKQVLNIYRFNYVLSLLNSNSEKTLTEISYLCGYYDQSHFIRDFKKVTGQTPKVISSNHKKIVQSIADRSFINSLLKTNL